jgi:hypothetical protein
MYDKKYILQHFGLQPCTNTEMATVTKRLIIAPMLNTAFYAFWYPLCGRVCICKTVMLKSPKINILSQNKKIWIASSGECTSMSRADVVLSLALLWSIWAQQNKPFALWILIRPKQNPTAQRPAGSYQYYFYARNHIFPNSELFQRAPPSTTDKIHHGIRNKIIQRNSRCLKQERTFSNFKQLKPELQDLQTLKRISFFKHDVT